MTDYSKHCNMKPDVNLLTWYHYFLSHLHPGTCITQAITSGYYYHTGVLSKGGYKTVKHQQVFIYIQHIHLYVTTKIMKSTEVQPSTQKKKCKKQSCWFRRQCLVGIEPIILCQIGSQLSTCRVRATLKLLDIAHKPGTHACLLSVQIADSLYCLISGSDRISITEQFQEKFKMILVTRCVSGVGIVGRTDHCRVSWDGNIHTQIAATLTAYVHRSNPQCVCAQKVNNPSILYANAMV